MYKLKMRLIELLILFAPLEFLIASVKAMGWNVSVDESEEFAEGLVIGTEEFIDKIFPDKVEE